MEFRIIRECQESAVRRQEGGCLIASSLYSLLFKMLLSVILLVQSFPLLSLSLMDGFSCYDVLPEFIL